MAKCLTPYSKRSDKTGEFQYFPCGRCPDCLKRRVSGWSYRLRKEGQRSDTAYFITLTYDTNHVPISGRGFMTLKKSDVQKFFKRLRKLHTKNGKQSKISYYACGEYGGQTNRPHYHLIIFNADLRDIEKSWSLGSVPIGGLHCGTVSDASIGYTLKYMCKPSRFPMFKGDDRVSEFSLMSKA